VAGDERGARPKPRLPARYLSRRLDILALSSYTENYRMKAKDLRRILALKGCAEVRQKGSHLRVECGSCVTTVPIHPGEDLGPGLLRAIERDLEPCLGKRWLRKAWLFTMLHTNEMSRDGGWLRFVRCRDATARAVRSTKRVAVSVRRWNCLLRMPAWRRSWTM